MKHSLDTNNPTPLTLDIPDQVQKFRTNCIKLVLYCIRNPQKAFVQEYVQVGLNSVNNRVTRLIPRYKNTHVGAFLSTLSVAEVPKSIPICDHTLEFNCICLFLNRVHTAFLEINNGNYNIENEWELQKSKQLRDAVIKNYKNFPKNLLLKQAHREFNAQFVIPVSLQKRFIDTINCEEVTSKTYPKECVLFYATIIYRCLLLYISKLYINSINDSDTDRVSIGRFSRVEIPLSLLFLGFETGNELYFVQAILFFFKTCNIEMRLAPRLYSIFVDNQLVYNYTDRNQLYIASLGKNAGGETIQKVRRQIINQFPFYFDNLG